MCSPRWLWLFLVISACSSASPRTEGRGRPADTGAATGPAIVGYVFDQVGAPLKGVKLVARSPTQIGGAKTAYSNAEGWFRFRSLDAGEFEVTASAPRLQTLVVRGVRVRDGAATELSLVMEDPSVPMGEASEVKVRLPPAR